MHDTRNVNTPWSVGQWQREPRGRGDRFWILSRGVWYRTAPYHRSALRKGGEAHVELSLRAAIENHEAGRPTALVATGERQYTLPAVL